MTLALALSLLLAPEASPAAPPLVLDMDGAVALGLRQNLDLELAEESLRTSESIYRQALAAAVPDANLSGTWMRNFNKSAAFFGNQKVEIGLRNTLRGTASAEQVVFSGGMVSSGIRAAKSRVASGRQQVLGSKSAVVLAVRKLFYSVLLSSETAAIEADSLATAEDHLRTIEERFRQGLDSDLVVLRQKVEVANARPPLLQARNAHEMAGILLKDALGLDVDAPASFVGSLSPPQGGPEPYERLQTRAIESNPEYRAALERASESEALVRVAQGMRYPQISLYADGQFYAETDQFWPGPMQRDFSSMGGLRLRFPLFTGGDLQERVRQARIEAEKARTRCRQMERSVRMEVKRHWLTAQVAAERSRSQESVIAQARRALEAMENRYKDGHASQLELHDATLALLRARLLYAQALHDYGVEIAEIEHAAGSAAEEPPR